MQRLPGLLIGAAVVAAMCALHATGVSKHVEQRALDFHFQWFNHIEASERIVHIDITDKSLKRWGRWPWPRDTIAGIIDVLDEAGARIIALDLIFPEPQDPEFRVPSRRAYARLEGEIETLGTPNEQNWVYTDDLLAAAMSRAGNVFIGVDFRDAPDKIPALEQRMDAMFSEPGQFGLNEQQVAERLDVTAVKSKAFQQGFPKSKRRVAVQLVDTLLQKNPRLTFRQIHAQLLDTPFDLLTPERRDLLASFTQALGVRHMLTKTGPVTEDMLQGRIPRVGEYDLTPPYFQFAEQARQIGFVHFKRDQVGGVVRSQPLLVEYRGRLLKQLGFAVACELMSIRDEEMRIDDDGDLVIEPSDKHPRMRVPLSDDGDMLTNWFSPKRGKWDDCFQHEAVHGFLSVIDLRTKRHENARKTDFRSDQLAEAFLDGQDQRKQYQSLAESRERLLVSLRDLRRKPEVSTDRLADEERKLEHTRQRISTVLQDAVALVRLAYEDAKDAQPQDDAEADELARINQAHAWVVTLDELSEANRRSAASIEAETVSIAEKVRGKICILGYAATALSDFVVTPVLEYAPGALVHSNVLNSFLQNRFIRQAGRSRTLSGIVIALAGLTAVLVTLSSGPVRSLLFVLAAIVAYFIGHGVIVFGWFGIWVASAMPIATIFVTWAFVTLYRQLTEERSKRHVAKVLGQYTSPAIAQNIVEATTDLSPREGVVTCYFSDLENFTGISEQLGAERTKAILNPYLEAMSDVLIRRGAMINKFIGDAVFAFFNAPLFACPDHEHACCHAALESLEALAALKAGNRFPDLQQDLQRLEMRLGINAGPVFVGDYGCENKLDYTCIGDTVNLAARLEPANKVFGTEVMISESTYAVVNGQFEVRHLGGLQVKGKQQAVQVYELLSRAGELDDERRRQAELFGRSVAAFQSRDFYAAAATFSAYLEAHPGDPGAARYLSLITLYKTAPPPDDWNGALELTEK